MSGSDAGKEASHCCVVSFLTDYYSTPDSWSVKQAGQKYYQQLTHGYIVRDIVAIIPTRVWLAP